MKFILIFLHIFLAYSSDFLIEGDRAKINFLFQVEKKIPSLFPDSAYYGTSLLEVLEKQNKLMEGLHNSKLPQSFAPRKSLKLNQGRFVRGQQKSYTEESLANFKDYLLQTLEDIKSNPEIENKLVVPGSSTVKITQLLMNLQIDTPIREILKGSFQDKIRFLKGLDPEVQLQKLAPKYRGEKELTLSSFIEQVESNKRKEDQLIAYYHYISLFQSMDGTQSEIEQNIKDLTLETFQKVYQVQGKLDSHFAHVKSKIKAGFNEFVKSVEKFKITEEKEEFQTTNSLVLESVAPQVALFRGCAGSDCATQYSSGYAINPYEYVYFIYHKEDHEKETPMGYLQGTTVLSNGIPSFYLHTISGGHISKEDVSNILENLPRYLSEQNIDQVIIPTPEKIKALINYRPIKEVLMTYSESTHEVPIEYLDSSYRTILNTFTDKDYDKEESNKSGLLLNSINKEDEFHSSVYTPKEEKVTDKDIDPAFLFLFAFDLNYTDSEVSSILKMMNYPEKEFDEFIKVFENTEGLSTEDFLASLARALHGIGVNPDDVIKKRKFVYQNGLFNASDAFSKKYKAQTIKDLVEFLKNNAVDKKEAAIKLLIAHKDVISKDEGFKKHFEALKPVIAGKLNEDEEEDVEQLLDFYNIGFMEKEDMEFLTDLSYFASEKILRQIVKVFSQKQEEYTYDFLKEFLIHNHSAVEIAPILKQLAANAPSLKISELILSLLQEKDTLLNLSLMENYFSHENAHSDIDKVEIALETMESHEDLAIIINKVYSKHGLPNPDALYHFAKTFKTDDPNDNEAINALLTHNLLDSSLEISKGRISEILSYANQETLQILIKNVFAKRDLVKYNQEIKQTIDLATPQTYTKIIKFFLNEDTSSLKKELLPIITQNIEDENSLRALINHQLKDPELREYFIDLIINKTKDHVTLLNLIKEFFRGGYPNSHLQQLDRIVEKSNFHNLKVILSKIKSKKPKEDFTGIIEKINQILSLPETEIAGMDPLPLKSNSWDFKKQKLSQKYPDLQEYKCKISEQKSEALTCSAKEFSDLYPHLTLRNYCPNTQTTSKLPQIGVPSSTCHHGNYFFTYTGKNSRTLRDVIQHINSKQPDATVNVVLTTHNMKNADISKLEGLRNIKFLPILSSRLEQDKNSQAEEHMWMRDSFIFAKRGEETVIIPLLYAYEKGKDLDDQLACAISLSCNIPLLVPQALQEGIITTSSLTSGGNFLGLPGNILAVGNVHDRSYLEERKHEVDENLQRQVESFKGNTILELDVGFLNVGHVDELFSVVKNDKPAPCNFTLIAGSPKVAFDIIEEQIAKIPADMLDNPVRCQGFDYEDLESYSEAFIKRQTQEMNEKFCFGSTPIEKLKSSDIYAHNILGVKKEKVGQRNKVSFNSIIEKNINKVVDALKVHTGCEEPIVAKIPILLNKDGEFLSPNPVNGIALNSEVESSAFLSPQTFYTPFDQATKEEISKTGVEVKQVYDLDYSNGDGDIHCGSNSYGQ